MWTSATESRGGFRISYWEGRKVQVCSSVHLPSLSVPSPLFLFLLFLPLSSHLSPFYHSAYTSFPFSSFSISGGARNFQLGKGIAQGYGRRNGSPHWGPGTKTRWGVCGTKSPKSWSSLQTLFTYFDAETTKIWIFRTIYLLYVLWWDGRPNRPIWGLSPIAHAWCRHCPPPSPRPI